jgi:hypothetical protein
MAALVDGQRPESGAKQLLPNFRQFIEHLASAGLSQKTIRNQRDNLWSLDGEIICDLHYDKTLRTLPAERLLRKWVHEFVGPAVHNGTEDQQLYLSQAHKFLSLSLTHEFLG